jgi:tetratricopeptide (TPR) repeat protein
MRRLLLSLISIALWTSSAHAADNAELWKQAAESYDAGQYRASIDNYLKLLERRFENPELYYNLGNANFKAGNLGAAIWSFRKALRINPGFRQARENLEYARTFNTDQVSIEKRGFILDIWDLLSGLLSSNGYLTLLAIAWWIGAAIAAYKIISPESPAWLYYLLIVPLIIIIFSTSAAVRRIDEDKLTRWGVVSVESVDIREGPGVEFSRLEVGHEGLEFKILGDRENSYLIELGNGLKGWIDKESVLEI